ncbi:MAG TPA: hypothetical protein VKG84_10345, partial [Candidatus Acidoferrales bacterium]|nr:hypothetical protein [Candidatus Acidoferrales bacterium]
MFLIVRRRRGAKAGNSEPGGFACADSSPCVFFQWLDDKEPKLKAVGWLAKNNPYKRAKVDPVSFHILLSLLAQPWTPACLPHRMECPFCPIINPDHGKKKQPWWVMRKGEADGLELVQSRTPESLAHVETQRLSRSGAHKIFQSASLFVPGKGFVFVAHPMIAHFVDAHGYDPPAEFWKAVKNCPGVQSVLYRQAMID